MRTKMETPQGSSMFPFLAKNAELLVMIVCMSVVSGLAQLGIKLRAGAPFSLLALVGELTISFSAALICGFVLMEHLPIGVVVGLSGVAGHMGARFIALVEHRLMKKMGLPAEPSVILDPQGKPQA